MKQLERIGVYDDYTEATFRQIVTFLRREARGTNDHHYDKLFSVELWDQLKAHNWLAE